MANCRPLCWIASSWFLTVVPFCLVFLDFGHSGRGLYRLIRSRSRHFVESRSVNVLSVTVSPSTARSRLDASIAHPSHACVWTPHRGASTQTSAHAGGVQFGHNAQYFLSTAQAECIRLGPATCKAVTCPSGGRCKVSGFFRLGGSQTLETTYVPSPTCYQVVCACRAPDTGTKALYLGSAHGYSYHCTDGYTVYCSYNEVCNATSSFRKKARAEVCKVTTTTSTSIALGSVKPIGKGVATTTTSTSTVPTRSHATVCRRRRFCPNQANNIAEKIVSGAKASPAPQGTPSMTKATKLIPTKTTTASASSSTNRPSALCIVGHVRTLPLTFDSIERFAIDNRLHTYMVLQLGTKKGSTWLQYGSKYFGSEMEQKLVKAVQAQARHSNASQQMDLRKVVVVPTGTCAEYQQQFASKERQFHTSCLSDATHSQVRHIRMCISAVLDSGVRYDRFVRIRADVAIFRKLLLADLPHRGVYDMHAQWKHDCPNVGGDWFFFMKFDRLHEFWTRVELEASKSNQQWPYLDFFMFRGADTKCEQLPIVIVRNSHMAECCRFYESTRRPSPSSTVGQIVGLCESSLKSGSFAHFTKLLHMGNTTPDGIGPFLTCNIDHGPR